jgi:hypothetical protein
MYIALSITGYQKYARYQLVIIVIVYTYTLLTLLLSSYKINTFKTKLLKVIYITKNTIYLN